MTPREEKFARLLVEGHSQAEAYRRTYPRARQWKPASVHNRASKLAAKVLPRVAELRAAAVEQSFLTLQAHMTELAELRDRAAEAGQIAAAISAEVKRGELMGFYVQRSDTSNVHYIVSDEPTEADWVAAYADDGRQNGGLKH